jgi:hypothetical protein
LEQVSEILDQMLSKLPRERDYNVTFSKIAEILKEKYSFVIPSLDLRFRFTLFMQEEFEKVPKEEWKLNDNAWLNDNEQKAKTKLISWIEDQIKEAAKNT